jgi:hypothetical protein
LKENKNKYFSERKKEEKFFSSQNKAKTLFSHIFGIDKIFHYYNGKI